MKNLIITRFAPSPSGILHIGNLRTIFFLFLYIQKNKGILILRIDDTNKNKIKSIYIIKILKYLKWLNIKFIKGLYFQSLRKNRYINIVKYFYKFQNNKKKIINFSLQKNNCILNCDTIYLNENFNIIWDDILKKKITINTSIINHFILIKKNKSPTYNFASSIDDIDMKINFVLRGEDHLINTSKQILIYQILNKKLPIYLHLPLIIDDNKKKISKRNNNLFFLKLYGYLSITIQNYLLSLGFSFKNKELYNTLQEMINIFDLQYINKSPSMYNLKKIEWFNKKLLSNTNIICIKNEIINNLLIKKYNFDIITYSTIIQKTKRSIISIYYEIKNIEKKLLFDPYNLKDLRNKKFYINILKKLYLCFSTKTCDIETIKQILNINFNNIIIGKKFLRKYILKNIKSLDIFEIIKLIQNKIILNNISSLIN